MSSLALKRKNSTSIAVRTKKMKTPNNVGWNRYLIRKTIASFKRGPDVTKWIKAQEVGETNESVYSIIDAFGEELCHCNDYIPDPTGQWNKGMATMTHLRVCIERNLLKISYLRAVTTGKRTSAPHKFGYMGRGHVNFNNLQQPLDVPAINRAMILADVFIGRIQWDMTLALGMIKGEFEMIGKVEGASVMTSSRMDWGGQLEAHTAIECTRLPEALFTILSDFLNDS
jgi:hypothetical protein